MLDHGAHVNDVNKDGTSPLLLACSTAQAETVRNLLKAKAAPNIADVEGDASLHAAIAANCSERTLQDIIDHGANVNAVNKKGRTALLLGCSYRHTDSVRVLLEAGADATIADEEGFSCLHAAIDGYCSLETLRALTDHGANINVARKDGTSAFLRACSTGQSESVKFLLEAGADVNITKPCGNTCLHEAVIGRCSNEILKKIIQHGVNVNYINSKSQTVLICACYAAQVGSVKLLLENGADPNISDDCSFTCLHAAVHGCCTNETLQEIITRHAHLDAQDTDGRTALLLACLFRRQDSVSILLEVGSNPNIADNDGITCLQAAVKEAFRKKVINTIINHGANVNAKNKDNRTALITACARGNKDAINGLLGAGADPKIVDANNDTCLHEAVMSGCNTSVLQSIIDHGADVNATNKNRVAILSIACQMGNVDAINVLLKAGADPTVTDAEGDTYLHYAVREDYSNKVIQTIINNGADVNAANENNVTALMIACEKGNVEAMNVLLNAEADPNIVDDCCDTCLQKAVRAGSNKEVLKTIINYGADVNAMNNDNRTALMISCENGNIDALNELLNAGGNPNITHSDEDTCLHKAISAGCNKEILQALIDHGADVNVTDEYNVTPLMIACEMGNVRAMNVFLNVGADPDIADDFGDTCLQMAIRAGCNKDDLQAIINHSADVNAQNKNNRTALMIVCKMGNLDAVNMLLNAGADPNISDADGNTCLHVCVGPHYKAQVLQVSIDHSDDVNATNKNNGTALLTACKTGNVDAIGMLLNAGAVPNITQCDGDTCFHEAISAGCNNEILQALSDHGADVNTTDHDNVTALMKACDKGNTDAINVLLNAGADPNIADAYSYKYLHYAVLNGSSK